MQDLVSTRWIRTSGLAASLPIALAMFASKGSASMAWMSLVWIGVATSSSMWLAGRSSNRSARQVIADLEGKGLRVAAPVGEPLAPSHRRSLMERN